MRFPFSPSRFLYSPCLVLLFLLSAHPVAAAAAPASRIETGTLNGAAFRIDFPERWNGVLLMYYHGYSQSIITFDRNKPNPLGAGLAAAGFAVAQSGYSVSGWAQEQAIPETEALRQYAIAHYGQPKETYVLGHSMGGQLALATIEGYPNRYDGALPLCGLLQPTTLAITRGGALIAAFNYYYPGLLPEPVAIGATVALDDALAKKVEAALPSNPTGLAEIRALSHIRSDEELASDIVFFTYIQRDLEQKIGASVLNNHNVVYAGGPDDNALNDGVKRYTASGSALAYLKTWYTPTGSLERPTLAVHTTYDPIIPAETTVFYADTVQRAGSSAHFVQQYVKHDGHCNIGGPETVAALGELIRWKRTGLAPAAGIVPTAEK
jgi:pimeloyl-ACP methyl ester carboxylesterase